MACVGINTESATALKFKKDDVKSEIESLVLNKETSENDSHEEIETLLSEAKAA